MNWFDKPRRWWGARWLHHAWLLSFNMNPDLYQTTWWARFTRFLFYNTRGLGGDMTFLALFIPFVLFITLTKLIFG